jgi:hypothetical protein
MSLMITILSEAGTLKNGRPRLVAQSFQVSPVRSHTQDLAELAGFTEAYAMLDGDCTGVEIDAEDILGLRIDPSLNMINGRCFDSCSHGVQELAAAQQTIRESDAVRVMIESGL